jgi:hypothetical protein
LGWGGRPPPAQAANPHNHEGRVWTSDPCPGPRPDPHDLPMTPAGKITSVSDPTRAAVADGSSAHPPVEHDAEGRLPAGSLPGWGLSWWLHEQGLLATWEQLSMSAPWSG